MKIQVLAITAAFLAAAVPLAVQAESSSSNYILWGQAAAGGGERTTSANYVNYGTAADVAGVEASSAGYFLQTGFEAIREAPHMSISLAPTSLPLSPNTLSPAGVSTAQTTVTVSTNADFGYVLTVRALSPFQNVAGDVIDGVVDGTVTAGSEEFGVSLTGTDRAFADDRAVTGSALTIASNGMYVTNMATTVTFKASISAATEAGQYQGSYTFIATSTY